MLAVLHALVFLAAFLLFQVELIASKAMLPGFGGSYLVWSVSVMLFQGLLLLGYTYAHIAGRLAPKVWFRRLMYVIALLPLAFFPISLSGLTERHLELPFVLDIAWALLATIGPGFFVLSSLSVLAQRYLASSRFRQSSNPFVLYATSNLGSFSGLLSYPFLVEPMLALHTQLALWEWLYALTALLFVAVHAWSGRMPQTAGAAFAAHTAEGRRKRAIWLLLSCAGSALFLSVTNVITFDIASVPLIWVAPLALFLFSFIPTFKERSWYPPLLRERFPLLAAIGVMLFAQQQMSYSLPVIILIPVHLVVLLLTCIICNGELNRAKPDQVGELAAFYIYMSLGGFLGGVLVAWIIPLISNSVIEYLAGFLLLALGLALQDRTAFPRRSWLAALVLGGVLLGWSTLLGRSQTDVSGFDISSLYAGGAAFCIALLFWAMRNNPWSQALALALALVLAQGMEHLRPGQILLDKHRNFYGVYTVYDHGPKRFLKHGTTLHGAQYLAKDKQGIPLTYYHPLNPAGELLRSQLLHPDNLAVIGLGAGALASYAQSGQDFVFYELDPYNEFVARKYFTYLKNCKGNLSVIIGDARLSLKKAPKALYSILMVDAFSSDAIPVHLYTVEAMELYLQHIPKNGAVLFHISNKYLDLAPVLAANAHAIAEKEGSPLYAMVKRKLTPPHPDAEASIWGALTRDPKVAALLENRLGWQSTAAMPLKKVAPWTDRYSNLLAVFR